jgi:hypothetical protein
VWPATVDQFSAGAGKSVAWRQIDLGMLDPAEAHEAICKAALLGSRVLSPLDIASISANLGDDPYTIGLWGELLAADSTASPLELAKNVQERFLSEGLARASTTIGLPAYKIDAALKLFAAEMLQRRELQPVNGAIEEWFADMPDVRSALVAVLHQGYMMRPHIDGRIQFRHDRLRDELLCRGLRVALNRNPELLREPFYAKYLGRAASEGILKDEEIKSLRAVNPVALCESFGWRPSLGQRQQSLIDAALTWVREDVVAEKALPAVIWQASAALFRSNVPPVLDITSNMPRNYYVLLARLKQGDAVSGAMLCGRSKGVFFPGVRAPQFENTVAHAVTMHRDKLLRDIAAALADDEKLRSDGNGLLLMVGYLASPKLLISIVSAWRRTPNPSHSLPFAVWATLRCAGGNGYANLEELLEFWKALSQEKDEHGMSPFWNVGSWLRHSFRWLESPESIRWLLRAAEENPVLKRVLSMLINEIDAPDSVEFAARYAGSVRKSLSPKTVLPMWLETRHWDPRDSSGRRLSSESQERLRMLWQSSATDEDVRDVAFRTWSVGCDRSDLDALRAIKSTDTLFQHSVWTRADLGDAEVVESLASLLREKPSFWWVAHKVWDARIRAVAEEILDELARTLSNDCAEYGDYRLEDIVEALVRLPSSEAEGLLEKFWSRLGNTRSFILGALRIGTPSVRVLAAQSIAACSPEVNLFEHASLRIVTHRLGEVIDYAAEARVLESLEPYIKRLWNDEFDALIRDFCRGKHREWCRRALFERMSHQLRSLYFPSDDDLVAAFESLLHRDVATDPNFKHPQARFWWEDLERRDVEPARVWAAIGRSNDTTASGINAEVVCELVGEFGSRNELALLEELTERAGHFPGVERASANAAFAVRIRVLE